MKIAQNTPDQLIIESQPWLVAVMLGIMLLVFVGSGFGLLISGELVIGIVFTFGTPLFLGVFFWAFVRRNQLILDARAKTLTHRRRTLTGYFEAIHKLDHLEKATVQTSRGDGANTHRMAFVLNGGMDAGVHPFTMAYTSGRGARRATDAVNTWLAGRKN